MAFNLKNFILSLVSGPVVDAGVDYLNDFLEHFFTKSPENCKALVSTAYIAIDLYAEDWAKQSSTNVDDKAVAAAKKELEDFAARHNFTLQNLDND